MPRYRMGSNFYTPSTFPMPMPSVPSIVEQTAETPVDPPQIPTEPCPIPEECLQILKTLDSEALDKCIRAMRNGTPGQPNCFGEGCPAAYCKWYWSGRCDRPLLVTHLQIVLSLILLCEECSHLIADLWSIRGIDLRKSLTRELETSASGTLDAALVHLAVSFSTHSYRSFSTLHRGGKQFHNSFLE